MAIVKGDLVFEGGMEEVQKVTLRIEVPTYAYHTVESSNEGGLDADVIVSAWRTAGGVVANETTLRIDAETYNIQIPGEAVLGTSFRALQQWAQAKTWDEWTVDISYVIADLNRAVVATGQFQALFYVDDLISNPSLNARNDRQNSNVQLPSRVFFVNAWAYGDLIASHPAPRGGTDQYALFAIQQLGVFTARAARIERPEDLNENELDEIATQTGTTRDVLKVIVSRWKDLTTFPITIPAREFIEAGGTLLIEKPEDAPVSLREFGYYRVTADMPVHTLAGRDESITFTADFEDLDDPVIMPTSFKLVSERPVVASAAAGPITVRLRGLDGSVLWRRSYAPRDDELRNIVIEVDAQLLGESEPEEQEDGGSALERKIRGQVLRRSGSLLVSGLTVVLQAKQDEATSLWTIISAGETDGSGYFWMPYPRGDFAAAQAIVSASPDSVVDLKIVSGGPTNETLADDFLYLLLDGTVAEAAAAGAGRSTRLPDQADLVRSDEYSQDLGGSCVNVTTPNRTLREYSYTALVRTSDPEVANYTLQKNAPEEPHNLAVYSLVPGAGTRERSPVNIRNPILWQDAPGGGDELSFYQAVTVSTGHILFFKSVFKADGYSLGDLVYSLPLAPGQKKQIVSYDVANTLEAGESQQITQGEQLTAGLIDDRFITDQLSGSIGESIDGSSSARTAGVSVGLGGGGSFGGIGGSLGVSGGVSNSRSSASQSGSRNLTQFFGERLRQSLMQNAEGYRQLNASVVTTVKEGQEYSVTTEVVANHNHCHSLTMMYFEVLRHYVIEQQLIDVQEALFVPLLLTEFNPDNIAKWKDVLAGNLRPTPSNMYLPHLLSRVFRRRHPLVRAFDANDRIRTNYTRVDFPEATYSDDPITTIDGEITLRVNFPRPRTRADRVLSLPIVTEVIVTEEIDRAASVAKKIFLGPWSRSVTRSIEEEVRLFSDISDRFIDLDDNFQLVPPSQAIRIKDFSPQLVEGVTIDFFENDEDRERWRKYAVILGLTEPYELMNQYFAGNLVSEWDGIFNQDIAPRLFEAALSAINFTPLGGGAGLNLDPTATSRYNGGERTIRVRLSGIGASNPTRRGLSPQLRVVVSNDNVVATGSGSFAKVDLQRVTLNYTTPHYRGTIFNGFVGGDLLDATGADIPIPLTPNDLRNPRTEDEYLVQELLDHLNANIEHYNALLWRLLDPNRRYMLLDGFAIETYTRAGTSAGMRSLASVVKNELITIVGNSLVFPVADGYHVSRSLVTADTSDDVQTSSGSGNPLLEQYRPNDEVPPYRLSIPTRGVYSEAVLGRCDSCENVKDNSSQDWDRFRTDEPTGISPVVTPTPQRTDWKAVWAQMAQPIVQFQTARDAPTPGAGLAGLSEALTKADAFRDVTGLAANQDNVIRTYLSNQENAKAFAEMAKSMAMQEHNSENSRGIMEALGSARESGAISDDDYRQMVRDHLGQQIDGGARQSAEVEREEREQPSLTNAAIEAVEHGREVTASRKGDNGIVESVQVRNPREDGVCELVSTGSGSVYIAESPIPGTEEDPWIRGRVLLANFDVCGTELKSEHEDALRRLMAQAGAPHVANFRLEKILGRASQTGGDTVNDRLSLERAEAVENFLSPIVDQIVDPPRGLGSQDPVLDRAGREEVLNRSVELEYFLILSAEALPDQARPEPSATPDQWEVRLVASVSGGVSVGGMSAVGELRRTDDPDTIWRFNYFGFGFVLGLAIPGASEDAEWTSFRIPYAATVDDFDGALCRLSVLSYGVGRLHGGRSAAYISFPMLDADSIYVGGSSTDIGAGGGTTVGVCNVLGR